MLWNNPGVGRVELGTNRTRWVADAARQIDYWVTTGTTPPTWSAVREGNGDARRCCREWACRLVAVQDSATETQDELLEVAREYKRRGLPLSVIVIDYFHWTRQGDWNFNPAEWPDPAPWCAELRELGSQLMVSVWPRSTPTARTTPR